MKSPISKEKWKALYQAAAEFREIEPWKWVKETDIFGVQNPATGETGYCCIMGELNEVLAIAVYLGTEGLNGYNMIIDEEITTENSDLLHVQNCLMASFENKNALEKEDKAIIQELGIKLKGRRAWPLFRRYEPGFMPWFLSEEEVQFLTFALQQAKHVCLRIKEDRDLLLATTRENYLVRVYDKDTGTWYDKWIKPDVLKHQHISAPIVDDLRIQRLKKNLKPSKEIWEIDFFYAPTPVKTEERPYYPYTIIIADSKTGFVHDVFLSEKLKYHYEFPESFLSCLEKASILPEIILANKDEVIDLLTPLVTKFGISIRRVNNLPAIDDARQSMEAFFLKNEMPGRFPEKYCGDELMEEYLNMAGSDISVFGLYGLLYACLVATDQATLSTLLSMIFGKNSPQFKSEKDASETIGNIMILWKILNEYMLEEGDILIPSFEYDQNVQGIMLRIVDLIDFADYFMQGLEQCGIQPEDMPDEAQDEIEHIVNAMEMLSSCIIKLEENENLPPDEIRALIDSIDRAEAIIISGITVICDGMIEKEFRNGNDLHTTFNSDLSKTRKGDKIGRNDPCPCGSGRKYKKCCGLIH